MNTGTPEKRWGGRLCHRLLPVSSDSRSGSLFFLSVVPHAGRQIATEAIIGADSAGFVRLQNLATDEGVLQLLYTSLSHLDERRRGELERSDAPVIVKWLARLGGDASDNVDDFTESMPREITLSASCSPSRVPRS